MIKKTISIALLLGSAAAFQPNLASAGYNGTSCANWWAYLWNINSCRTGGSSSGGGTVSSCSPSIVVTAYAEDYNVNCYSTSHTCIQPTIGDRITLSVKSKSSNAALSSASATLPGFYFSNSSPYSFPGQYTLIRSGVFPYNGTINVSRSGYRSASAYLTLKRTVYSGFSSHVEYATQIEAKLCPN